MPVQRKCRYHAATRRAGCPPRAASHATNRLKVCRARSWGRARLPRRWRRSSTSPPRSWSSDAGNVCLDNQKRRIVLRHIQLPIRNDQKLADLLGAVTTILQGGVPTSNLNALMYISYTRAAQNRCLVVPRKE